MEVDTLSIFCPRVGCLFFLLCPLFSWPPFTFDFLEVARESTARHTSFPGGIVNSKNFFGVSCWARGSLLFPRLPLFFMFNFLKRDEKDFTRCEERKKHMITEKNVITYYWPHFWPHTKKCFFLFFFHSGGPLYVHLLTLDVCVWNLMFFYSIYYFCSYRSVPGLFWPGSGLSLLG